METRIPFIYKCVFHARASISARENDNLLSCTPGACAYNGTMHNDDPRIVQSVYRAVRKGLLVRKPCERCGAPRTTGHHENVSRALDVVWLCAECHSMRHRELQEAGWGMGPVLHPDRLPPASPTYRPLSEEKHQELAAQLRSKKRKGTTYKAPPLWKRNSAFNDALAALNARLAVLGEPKIAVPCECAEHQSAETPYARTKKRFHYLQCRGLRNELRGELVPQPCIVCGMHQVKTVPHFEYPFLPSSKIWLCRNCHKRRHREIEESLTAEVCGK